VNQERNKFSHFASNRLGECAAENVRQATVLKEAWPGNAAGRAG